MTITLYGIKNCDTVRKARRWLDDHAIAYHFHDLRADGIDASTLNAWISAVGLETVINKRSTTWRQLSDAERVALTEECSALPILQQHPTLIKRPVLDNQQVVVVGFKPAEYAGIVP